MPSDESLQKAHREYMESRILSAQPVVIIQMLYEVAIKSLKMAITELANGDIPARTREVNRAQEAVSELMLALDHSAGASFSHSLANLYTYAQREILQGHMKKSAASFQNALSVMTILEEGWSGVCEQVLAKSKQQDAAYVMEESTVAPVQMPTRWAEYQPETSHQSRDWSC